MSDKQAKVLSEKWHVLNEVYTVINTYRLVVTTGIGPPPDMNQRIREAVRALDSIIVEEVVEE